MGATPYATLTPDCVLAAVESAGFLADGHLQALNSFENRVYQVGIEDSTPLIAKFYRPGRWSDAAIREEHAYALELAQAELPMIAPLVCAEDTLQHFRDFRFALYLRQGGRAPELESTDNLEWMGRLLARMHNIGARNKFHARGTIDLETLVHAPAAAVLASALLPPALHARYAQAIGTLATLIAMQFAAAGAVTQLRLHGDCHPGNILWTDSGPHFVDLDDARMGPAIQDLWMLAPNSTALDTLLEGYTTFRDFDYRERMLIEPLRIMRQIHHAGWIAARWDDPAFPAAFPFAAQARWWEQHLADLIDAAEQLSQSS